MIYKVTYISTKEILGAEVVEEVLGKTTKKYVLGRDGFTFSQEPLTSEGSVIFMEKSYVLGKRTNGPNSVSHKIKNYLRRKIKMDEYINKL